MKCKKCGQEIDKKAVVCVGCGCKVKKPIYKKWWFYVVIALVVIIASSASSTPSTTDEKPEGNTDNSVATEQKTEEKNDKKEEITYETVDLQVLFDDLSANAMKAEKTYQNKYVEFNCKIKNFDSDGSYISVEPVNASEWNFDTAMCYIKNSAQKDYLIEKNVGDTITIKGKIKSIGEVLGYSIDIKEVK